jgi:polyisoprenoid-binding protein YceI
MNRKLLLALRGSLVCFALAQSALAGDGEIKISVTLKPAGSFVAESSEVKVRGKATRAGAGFSVEYVLLDLDTLKTGISLRDRHMKERYFETGKTQFKWAQLLRAQGSGGRFTGELKMHGVTRKIAGTYEVGGGRFKGNFPLKISEFGIEAPKYMGVGVSDDVKVEISIPEAVANRAPSSVQAPASVKKPR